MMALKYDNVVAVFKDKTPTPVSVKSIESFFILSTDYTSSSVRDLIKLKDVDHSPNFESVMNFFHVETVKTFLKSFFDWFFPRSLHVSFVFQVQHHLQIHLHWEPVLENFVEYVWGRCKLCGFLVAEVRVFDADEEQKFKKLHSIDDKVFDMSSRGKGCILFKTHLNVH